MSLLLFGSRTCFGCKGSQLAALSRFCGDMSRGASLQPLQDCQNGRVIAVFLETTKEHTGQGPGKLTKLREANVKVTFQFADKTVIVSDTIQWLAYGQFKAVYAFREYPWVLKFVPRKSWDGEYGNGIKAATMFAEDARIRELAPHYFGHSFVKRDGVNYAGDAMSPHEGADAAVLVCERVSIGGSMAMTQSVFLACSELTWLGHVRLWKALVHHMAKWVRAGYMPWDLKFDNLGLDIREQWRTVDFDVFETVKSDQAASRIGKKWWMALKRVIKDYRELVDQQCHEEWARRTAMLASADLLWPHHFGPNSKFYSERPVSDVLLEYIFMYDLFS